MNLNAINELLRGRTDVDGIILSWNPERLWYEVILSLSVPDVAGSWTSLLFLGVHGLRLREIGMGRSQLPCLRVSDARERQWDRIRYEVEELERSLMHFFCNDIEVLDTPATRAK